LSFEFCRSAWGAPIFWAKSLHFVVVTADSARKFPSKSRFASDKTPRILSHGFCHFHSPQNQTPFPQALCATFAVSDKLPSGSLTLRTSTSTALAQRRPEKDRSLFQIT
jgi:hypothetical protein